LRPFEPALQSLANKQVQVTPLISGIYPLSQGVAAIEKASQPGTLKVLIEM